MNLDIFLGGASGPLAFPVPEALKYELARYEIQQLSSF